ncbi:MAG: adenylosuccinate synthase [Phycisphaeraceae bacterium]|nr:adenylosuccinate synthase [Phycisphaeraceae bacterium]MCW5754266.1 adenylosuccinate synthase [Phycisphaeraceae bacterium]
MPEARATAVVGLQWGDEGKGKLVDLLAAEHDVVVRYNGGANAGHSVVVNGERFALHLVPCGILYPGKLAVVGNGVVVDPDKLLDEVTGLVARGVDCSGLVVSDRAHVVLPYHKTEDALREDELRAAQSAAHTGEGVLRAGEIGTTKRGIGPAYADKAYRASAIRIGDLLRPEVLGGKVELACLFKNALFRGLGGRHEPVDPRVLTAQLLTLGERLGPMIRDTVYLLHEQLAAGKRLLFEGGNATLLDVDHGTYPFVTSSACSALGIGSGTGVPPQRIGKILGVCKAYCTRVGAGPMPTEQVNAAGERIRERGREYGTTTGRPRRTGWLDLVALRYAVMVNGATGLALTMLDVMAGFDEINVCTAYDIGGERTDRFPPDGHMLRACEPVYETLAGFGEEITGARRRADLPRNAARYVEFIEEAAGVRAEIISVGPDRVQTIVE